MGKIPSRKFPKSARKIPSRKFPSRGGSLKARAAEHTADAPDQPAPETPVFEGTAEERLERLKTLLAGKLKNLGDGSAG